MNSAVSDRIESSPRMTAIAMRILFDVHRRKKVCRHAKIVLGVVPIVSLLCFPYFGPVHADSVKEEQVPASAVVENPGYNTHSIMQQQLLAYRKKLEESESHLQDFQRKHGIVLHETQIDHLLDQRKRLDNSLKDAHNRVMAFKEKLSWVREQIKDVPQHVPLTDVSREQTLIGSAKNNLLNLQLKEQELLNKYTENNPHVQAIRKEMELINRFIDDQQAQLDRSVTTGKNPLYTEMEMQLFRTQSQLVEAEAEKQGIRNQIAEVDHELDRLRSLRPALDELKRQVMADEKNYLNYLSKVGKTPPEDYQIQVGDQLDIKFFFNPELNETVLVRPDGRIALQLVGEISVVGHTVSQIRRILIKNYSGQLKNPEVAIILRSSNVSGEVFSPSFENGKGVGAYGK